MLLLRRLHAGGESQLPLDWGELLLFHIVYVVSGDQSAPDLTGFDEVQHAAAATLVFGEEVEHPPIGGPIGTRRSEPTPPGTDFLQRPGKWMTEGSALPSPKGRVRQCHGTRIAPGPSAVVLRLRVLPVVPESC